MDSFLNESKNLMINGNRKHSNLLTAKEEHDYLKLKNSNIENESEIINLSYFKENNKHNNTSNNDDNKNFKIIIDKIPNKRSSNSHKESIIQGGELNKQFSQKSILSMFGDEKRIRKVFESEKGIDIFSNIRSKMSQKNKKSSKNNKLVKNSFFNNFSNSPKKVFSQKNLLAQESKDLRNISQTSILKDMINIESIKKTGSKNLDKNSLNDKYHENIELNLQKVKNEYDIKMEQNQLNDKKSFYIGTPKINISDNEYKNTVLNLNGDNENFKNKDDEIFEKTSNEINILASHSEINSLKNENFNLKKNKKQRKRDSKHLFIKNIREGSNSISGENSESENSKNEVKSNSHINSFSESNPTDQKSFYSRAYKDRIFWSKEKMDDIRKRLNLARVKLIQLEGKEFEEIYKMINENNFQVLYLLFIN